MPLGSRLIRYEFVIHQYNEFVTHWYKGFVTHIFYGGDVLHLRQDAVGIVFDQV